MSLGLLHGAQPDALVLCHEPTRKHMRGLSERPLPSLAECLEANVYAARLTNPAVRCVGLAIDTSRLDPSTRERYLGATEDDVGLPCVDPVATGVDRVVDALA